MPGSLASRATVSIAVAFITDEDSVYYYSGFYDYLHMDFGRPTVLVIPNGGECRLVTAAIELEMAERMAPWLQVEAWQDGLADEWRGPLQRAIEAADGTPIGIEPELMRPLVSRFVATATAGRALADVTR